MLCLVFAERQTASLSPYLCQRPKLYFVKVDVQACFDTIEQTKLLEILRELISEVNLLVLCGNEVYSTVLSRIRI